jgi:hypothetical protein
MSICRSSTACRDSPMRSAFSIAHVLPFNDRPLALPGRLLIFKPSGSPKPAVRNHYSESRATLEMKIISTACVFKQGFQGAAIRSC